MISTSAFEILGPIMVGPSSSHTAGALRIALIARSLAPQTIEQVDFYLYNSFARTHQGHGTDYALVAGILGLAPDDEHVRDAFELAQKHKIAYRFIEAGENEDYHPNTVRIALTTREGTQTEIRGESLGGGRVRVAAINGVDVSITGELPTIFIAHQDRSGALAKLCAVLAQESINIATVKTFRESPGGNAYTIFETDEPAYPSILEALDAIDEVNYSSLIEVPGATPSSHVAQLIHGFSLGSELLKQATHASLSFGTYMREREYELAQSMSDKPQQFVDERIERVLSVMREECQDTLETPRASLGGYLNAQAQAVDTASAKLASSLMGEVLTRATSYAMAVLERSASMGIIVAAPTAGSAGVVSGAVLAVAEAQGSSDAEIKNALFCAAAIGALIAEGASVSGAQGGCQAEVGSASAMAAAALVELLGGNNSCALEAASLALANTLGLVCDPVQGLVEYPCQLRNAMGVSVAISAAQLALSGVKSPIPFDEVVDTMRSVGELLPVCLKETAQAGLAAAPSACAACAFCSD